MFTRGGWEYEEDVGWIFNQRESERVVFFVHGSTRARARSQVREREREFPRGAKEFGTVVERGGGWLRRIFRAYGLSEARLFYERKREGEGGRCRRDRGITLLRMRDFNFRRERRGD